MNALRLTIYVIRAVLFLPFAVLGSKPVGTLGLIGAWAATCTIPGAHFGFFVELAGGVVVNYHVSRWIARRLHPGEISEGKPSRKRPARAVQLPRVTVVAPSVSVPSLETAAHRLSPLLRATMQPVSAAIDAPQLAETI